MLNASTGGNFSARFVELLALGTASNGPVVPGLVIVLGIFAVIMSAVQAVLLLFRLGSVIILAGTMPLAAAGMLTPLTRPWLKRQIGWMLALIFYKPCAALVYATGFVLFGSGKSAEDLLMGFAVLLLSLIALPALMKFFTWTTGQVETGGSGVLGAVIGAASAVGTMRFYSSMSAAGQAQQTAGALGQLPGGRAGGAPGPAPGGGPAAGGGPPGGGARPGAGAGPGTSGPAAGGGAAPPQTATAAGRGGMAAAAGGVPGVAAGAMAGAASTAARSATAAAGTGAAAAGPAAGMAAAASGPVTAAPAAAAGAAVTGPAGVIMVGAQAATTAAQQMAAGATQPPEAQP